MAELFRKIRSEASKILEDELEGDEEEVDSQDIQAKYEKAALKVKEYQKKLKGNFFLKNLLNT